MKSKTAYAIVDKKNPKIDIYDIYSDKNVLCAKGEKIIKVVISEYKEVKKKKNA